MSDWFYFLCLSNNKWKVGISQASHQQVITLKYGVKEILHFIMDSLNQANLILTQSFPKF